MSGKTSDPIDMAHLLLAFFIIGALWQAASMVLEQALAAGTVPRLPDLVCPDDDRRPLAAHRIQPVPHGSPQL